MSLSQRFLLVAAFASFVTACGGGSGGDSLGAVVGLSAPSQMQVVTVDEASPLAPPIAAAQSNLPPDCDYATDNAFRHVFDPSMEAIQQVNNILCYVGQTGGAEMVNQGPYNAQIDTAKCESGDDSSNSSQGQSSGSNAQQPEIWVIDSVRASNDEPQIVHVWLPQHDGGVDGTIQVEMVIDKGPSTDNPFGTFTLNFAAITATDPIDDPRELGSLATLDASSGQRGFTFYNKHGDVTQLPPVDEEAREVAVVVEMSADQSTGSARVSNTYRRNDSFGGDTGILSEEFQLAFDPDDVLRGHDADPSVCLSRTDYHVNTWRYNLYDATTGERIELNSGFPFETATGEHGWLGYWGIWAPNGVTISNGDTITRVAYGDDTTTDYTVVKAPGKLIKHTRNTLDLADATDENFEWWSFFGGFSHRLLLRCTGTGFEAIAQWDDINQVWEPYANPVPIDTSTYGYLNMWSQSLGGQVSYVDGDTFVTYYAESFVNGASDLFTGASTIDFYGYVSCLKSEMLAVDAESGDIYLADSTDVATPYHFVLDKSDLTLMYDDSGTLRQVGLLDGETPSSGLYTWGMRSGPMVLDTGSLQNPWQVWNQDVFYTYETGANSWNQYTSAVDSNGDYVVFDAPIQFTYTHTTAADANADSTYDTKKYLLGYGGPGDLWGIPSAGIDFNNDGNYDRFLPLFSIADGTVMGPTGTEYLIRAIDSELTLQPNVTGCGALDLATAGALVLPDGSSYVTPDIGPAPVVTDPPAVIYGEVQ